MQTISLSTHLEASQQVAWDVISDHSLYGSFTGTSQVTLEKQGTPHTNGVGAIRVFHVGPIRIREEITTFEPPKQMAYRVLSLPLPLRNCRSDLLLVPCEDGGSCILHWDSWFELAIPFTGGVLRRVVAAQLNKIVAGIAVEVARRAGSAS
ncbi:MAG: SRPBCC family protein [bacterium]|nr:SRPBCC family protein [bacterium]